MVNSIPPSAMKAWQFSSITGGIEKTMRINPSTPLPAPNNNQHLVKIIATALNPIDYKPIEKIPGVFPFAVTKPATPGIDFVGSIVKPAEGSTLKAGQKVFGASGNSPIAGGALAQFNVAATSATVALPDNVDPIDAATVGVAGLTAYQSIVPNVKQGDKIFINGGSGGTGLFSIQIAKAMRCHVTTTCSTANVALCRNIGADRVIDYRKEDVLEALKASGHQYDHAVDNVGTNKELFWHCHEFLKPRALYIAVGGEPSLDHLTDSIIRKLWPSFLGGIKGNIVSFWPRPNTEDYSRIGDLMSSGKVKAVIDQSFKFEEAPQAVAKLKTGRAKGKIVVEVASCD